MSHVRFDGIVSPLRDCVRSGGHAGDSVFQAGAGRVIRILLVLTVLAFAGCGEFQERLRRGEPGSPGYIAPDYRKVEMVHFEPEFVKDLHNGTAHRDAYSVIQDDRGRRYRVRGRAGEVGDQFEMDVSLLDEI